MPEAESIYKTQFETVAQFRSWLDGYTKTPCFPPKVESNYLLETRSVYESFGALPDCRYLGDFVDVRIGVVTGANRFFVLERESVEQSALPEEGLEPIFSRFALAPGLFLTKSDLQAAIKAGERCLLLRTDRVSLSASVDAYLRQFDDRAREKNVTFKKRPVWHQPVLGTIPEAFLSYMNATGPRIVINSAYSNSTNTVHRLYFKDPKKNLPLVCALSILSTPSQLSAECEGRVYGDGVLKIEPSEARKIRIFVPRVNNNELQSVARKIDVALRRGDYSLASNLADGIIKNHCNISDSKLREAKRALERMRQNRLSR
jgi:hypothetical protein